MGTVNRGTLAVLIRNKQRPPTKNRRERKTLGKDDIRAGYAASFIEEIRVAPTNIFTLYTKYTNQDKTIANKKVKPIYINSYAILCNSKLQVHYILLYIRKATEQHY